MNWKKVICSLKKLIWKEIKKLRRVFKTVPRLGLEQLVSNQKKVLPVIIETEEKYVPKIILASLERLAQLLDSHKSTAKQVKKLFHVCYFKIYKDC